MLDPTPWSDSFRTVVDTVAKHIGPSILTCCMVGFMYIGYETIQRGSFWDAMQILVTSKEARDAQEVAQRSARLQQELRTVAEADQFIAATLTALLDGESGNAVRARLAIIHNGVNALNQTGMLKYDIVAGVAERGRAVGDLTANLPLSQWADFLPDLLAGRCKMLASSALSEATTRQRLDAMGIVEFLVCPVRDTSGGLLGVVSLSWDVANAADAQVNVAETTRRTQEAADRIGLVYAMRPKSPN